MDYFLENYLLSIVIGILSSLIASIVFLFFISRLRPKIIISKTIAKGQSSEGKTIYRIKIINKTRRSIINIKAQLHLMTPSVVPGGIILKSKEILLKRSDPMEISRFDHKDIEGRYAFHFVTYEDLEALWLDDVHSYLRFRIFAMDSLSGFGKVFTQDYHTKRNSLICGDFEFGYSLKIK